MRTTRGEKKNHTDFTCTSIKSTVKFHIIKPSNPTVWFWNSLKCHKYHFLVKRYTSFRGYQNKMAVPHWTLDNTNVLTVKNIYCKTFFFCLGILNAHQEISEKSSCMTVRSKRTSPLFPSKSLQCNQTPPSQSSFCCLSMS